MSAPPHPHRRRGVGKGRAGRMRRRGPAEPMHTHDAWIRCAAGQLWQQHSAHRPFPPLARQHPTLLLHRLRQLPPRQPAKQRGSRHPVRGTASSTRLAPQALGSADRTPPGVRVSCQDRPWGGFHQSPGPRPHRATSHKSRHRSGLLQPLGTGGGARGRRDGLAPPLPTRTSPPFWPARAPRLSGPVTVCPHFRFSAQCVRCSTLPHCGPQSPTQPPREWTPEFAPFSVRCRRRRGPPTRRPAAAAQLRHVTTTRCTCVHPAEECDHAERGAIVGWECSRARVEGRVPRSEFCAPRALWFAGACHTLPFAPALAAAIPLHIRPFECFE